MRTGFGAKARWALAVLGVTALTGCGAPGEGGSLGDMLLYAGTTPPPVKKPETIDVYCPPVDIPEGGAAIQAYSGGQVGNASALRSQIAISHLARECVGQPDGTTVVKVGVEGRALLGAGGGGARQTVPVNVVVRRGTTVIAARTRQVSVSIPAGDTQGTFSVVEEGLVVPAADVYNFTIEVSLGGRAATARRRG